jgi:hypothetical protein
MSDNHDPRCQTQIDGAYPHCTCLPKMTPETGAGGIAHWLALLGPCFVNPDIASVDFYTQSGKVAATVTRIEWQEALASLRAAATPEMEVAPIDSTRNVASTDYQGPIKVGMHFIWEPTRPAAWAHIVVTEIKTHAPNGFRFDERRIQTENVTRNRYGREGDVAWNEEGRFREACRPCDETGTLLTLGEATSAPAPPVETRSEDAK